jgi:hypothetical protein
MTVRDICLDPDLFRAAFPHWPHPEPEQETWEPVPPDEDWLYSRADYDDTPDVED